MGIIPHFREQKPFETTSQTSCEKCGLVLPDKKTATLFGLPLLEVLGTMAGQLKCCVSPLLPLGADKGDLFRTPLDEVGPALF